MNLIFVETVSAQVFRVSFLLFFFFLSFFRILWEKKRRIPSGRNQFTAIRNDDLNEIRMIRREKRGEERDQERCMGYTVFGIHNVSGGEGVEEDEKGRNGGVRIIYNRGNASVNILWDKFSNALSPLMRGWVRGKPRPEAMMAVHEVFHTIQLTTRIYIYIYISFVRR